MVSSALSLAHFISGALGNLVALDEGDGLLDFQTILQPVARDYEGKNAPLLIGIALCGGILQFLIRHTMIRVLGTCLVIACFENTRQDASDPELPKSRNGSAMASSVLTLLRKTRLLRTRLRRSIIYALIYSIASGCCSTLASSISGSYIWLTLAEVATVVLLERLHLEWTNAIAMRTLRTAAASPSSCRTLLQPTILYAIAQKITVQLPLTLGRRFALDGVSATDTAATRDIVVLSMALALRSFVLYPAWASLIIFETQRKAKDIPTATGGTFIHVLKMCYQRVLLRLSGLHLQAAGIMIVIELGTSVLFHSLLSMPLDSTPT